MCNTLLMIQIHPLHNAQAGLRQVSWIPSHAGVKHTQHTYPSVNGGSSLEIPGTTLSRCDFLPIESCAFASRRRHAVAAAAAAETRRSPTGASGDVAPPEGTEDAGGGSFECGQTQWGPCSLQKPLSRHEEATRGGSRCTGGGGNAEAYVRLGGNGRAAQEFLGLNVGYYWRFGPREGMTGSPWPAAGRGDPGDPPRQTAVALSGRHPSKKDVTEPKFIPVGVGWWGGGKGGAAARAAPLGHLDVWVSGKWRALPLR